MAAANSPWAKAEARAEGYEAEVAEQARLAVERAKAEAKRREKEAEMEAAVPAGMRMRRRAWNVAAEGRQEVALLGPRVQVVVTGSLAAAPEQVFAIKPNAFKGLEDIDSLSDEHHVALVSRCGCVPNFARPNQDDYFYLETTDNLQVAGVFDGHGRDGHRVAARARDSLMRALIKRIPTDRDHMHKHELNDAILEAMSTSFAIAQRELLELEEEDGVDMDMALSGAAACVMVYDQTRRWLYMAWTGNVRCVLAEVKEEVVRPTRAYGQQLGEPGQRIKTRRLAPVALTREHTTRHRDERSRITSLPGTELRRQDRGPMIICLKDFQEEIPGIPLTRCLGNLVAQRVGVIASPELREVNFEKEKGARFVILATDGVWGVLPDVEVIKIVNDAKKENVQYGAETVAQVARELWSRKLPDAGAVDDITLCVLWF